MTTLAQRDLFRLIVLLGVCVGLLLAIVVGKLA